ncbi:SigE family RNA polymerase sigma factor [Streptomyces sp. TR06-5]|uniref:SigE family RNA polymerase sigma factor n=1 Tax=unclassified Streptomyces TaxID=2593676 RepID=UPI00399F08E4
MSTLHSTRNRNSVVTTRLHTPAVPANRVAEKQTAVNGRGCHPGAPRTAGRAAADGCFRPGHAPVVEERVGRAPQVESREPASLPRGGEKRRDSAEAEFTAYVRERRASLYATAYHLTGDRYEAEDLLQSALFSTYRAWDRITDKSAVGGYLRRTMTNLHISAWRRRKLNEYPTEELPESPSADHDAMRGTELRTVLWQALARLPETQRTMLVLRYYEGRTDLEIADLMDISVGTVKSGIWRSLRRLRDDEVLSFGRDRDESFGELVA